MNSVIPHNLFEYNSRDDSAKSKNQYLRTVFICLKKSHQDFKKKQKDSCRQWKSTGFRFKWLKKNFIHDVSVVIVIGLQKKTH